MATSHSAIAALLLAVGVGAVGAPTTAQAGFLEQLFGVAPEPAPQAPAYDYGQPAPAYRLAPAPSRPKRKIVASDKPKLQKTTELMRDTTLQAGDAVMTKDGLRIYTGDDGVGHHSKADFDTIDSLDGVPKAEKVALMALDTTRNDPLRHGTQPDTVASGRSASVSTNLTQGHTIVDAKGRSVRYVGP